MIKSMTGFASVDRELNAATVGVTVRSVNHRHLDVQVRLSARLASQEGDLRGLVQKWVARGRVELAVTIRASLAPAVKATLNESLVEALAKAMGKAQGRGLASGGLTAGDLIRFPGAIVVQEEEADEGYRQAINRAVADEVNRALGELDAMRTREGEYLRADLETRCVAVAGLVDRLAEVAEAGQEALLTRLKARVADLREHAVGDDTLVAQEMVRFAARSDVSEELTRLRGHLSHWTALSDGVEPCGRKLDFLLQEMNREVNTLGAKVEGTTASELIVTTKAELEKLREQVQNVE